jgi:hypothetical protein
MSEVVLGSTFNIVFLPLALFPAAALSSKVRYSSVETGMVFRCRRIDVTGHGDDPTVNCEVCS